MTMTKRGKVTVSAVLLIIVLAIVLSLIGSRKGQASTANLAGVPAQGVTGIPDYRLVPILNVQGTEVKQVYLNTSVTPALFFATGSSQSQKSILAIQDKLSKMGTEAHKPLVLVSTFVKTPDQAKATADAKAFLEKNKVTLPIAVQVGPPTEFVKQTPSLVYTDEKGTHIVTDEKEILDALNTVLALPVPQPAPQAAPQATTQTPAKK